MNKEFIESELWLNKHRQLADELRKWQEEHPNATSQEYEEYKKQLIKLFEI